MQKSTGKVIDLYEHNEKSYNLINSSFDSGNNIVGIVHATGTGKSYIALQLAYDNRDKKIVYVVPSNGIIEHIKKIIKNNANLELKRDFSNLEFRTYQSFISLSEKEISDINCDLLILDEFHHIGAPIWGARINTMINTHPDMKIFGLTAYTVRDRKTVYERDMANPETNELFSNKIVSRYDICDAMIDGVLPKPIYKTAYINLLELEQSLEKKLKDKDQLSKDYQECMPLLKAAKKRIHEASSIPDILKKNIKPNGKYIYFCPPCSEEGANDIETIKKQALEWFKQFVPEKDIVIYTSTSDMGENGKKNREAFYQDLDLKNKRVDNKLRVMFAINQYNEGVHAPNIDGVIMGRGTTSDIVYFEQLGRALSVRGNTKSKFDEFLNYSLEELISICKEKDILIKDNLSKEEIIEKLIAPVVIDLTNNYDFIKDLENELKDRIKEINEKGSERHNKVKIKDASFDIEVENKDLFEMLRYVMDRLTMTWKDKYELAKIYYEYYGNLDIPGDFKTINGYEYDPNGVKLGEWIQTQRGAYRGTIHNRITEEQIRLLKEIGMIFENVYDNRWMKNYELAKIYYEHYGNLDIPNNFKTINGYEYNPDGVNLSVWIKTQRNAYNGTCKNKISNERIKLLKEIGMIFENVYDNRWMKNYELAKIYYEHYGNLDIPNNFKTINGYEYNPDGVNLSVWIKTQRNAYNGTCKNKISNEQIRLLKEIGMIFENVYDNRWMKNYELAKIYYEHYRNLDIPNNFKTINGYEYNPDGVKLGEWIQTQKNTYKGFRRNKLTLDQIEKLEKIGIEWFSKKSDIEFQNKIINDNNKMRKQKEILNRFSSLLLKYNEDTLVDKERINKDFIYQLNNK